MRTPILSLVRSFVLKVKREQKLIRIMLDDLVGLSHYGEAPMKKHVQR